ncbi:hypothetical protein ACIBCN_44370 [Nocardia sp. NPDC051052]|uniref:hypothetical protein n=1 Tax=Nocardia sp. NPDC051052 TaxID=3364322 RepID=UPI0037A192E3
MAESSGASHGVTPQQEPLTVPQDRAVQIAAVTRSNLTPVTAVVIAAAAVAAWLILRDHRR